MASKSQRKGTTKSTQTGQQIVLLTGFEPFADDPGGLRLNPSGEIAAALHGERVGEWRVAGHVLPCEYRRSVVVLRRLLREYQPKAVISLGQAGGRGAISIERIGVNWDEATLADNAGVLRNGQPILKSAPAAYFSSLPLHAMRDAIAACGLPAEISSTAGHFVCNHLFFSLQHILRKGKIPSGFVHVPYLPQQAGHLPALSLGEMTKGIRAAISAL